MIKPTQELIKKKNKMLTGIHTISFDLDDTLWDNKKVVLTARGKLFNKIVELYPDFANYFNLQGFSNYAAELLKQKNWRCDLTALRIAHIENTLKMAKCSTEKTEELSDYYFYWRNQVELFPAVEQTLAELASRYALIAITNGNANVNEIGIGQYFQFTISAADVGEKKPSPVLFEYAITQANQQPDKMVHIGDKYDQDVVGAIRVGMKAIWVNPKNKPCLNRPKTLIGIIRSVDELLHK